VAFWNRNNEHFEQKDSIETKTKEQKPELEKKAVAHEPSVMSGLPPKEPAPIKSNNSNHSDSDCTIDRFGKVRSALGSGTVIQGKLSFDTPVRIDGKLSGEIFSSNALIVGESGTIEAQVEAASLIILGKVKGTVKVTDRIELHAGGSLEGDVKAPTLVIHSGAQFNGNCAMGHKEESLAIPERRSTHTAKTTDAVQKPAMPAEVSKPNRDKSEHAKGVRHEVRTH